MPHDSRTAAGFRLYPRVAEGDVFEELLASVRFEDLGKGRRGAVLTRADDAGRVPIVRTTTRYAAPARPFRPVHARLARLIQERGALAGSFNNALIETYTDAYATMGAHSDQALDLAEGSCIALFSCYERPAPAAPPRALVVVPKAGGEAAEIPLADKSAVVFSLDTNRRYRHKIVLAAPAGAPENRWLGVTFRASKTVVRFDDGRAYLADGTPLTPADDEQRREFYRLRGRENAEADFEYPRLTYTVSASDLVPPEPG